jgi:chorismate-pyruvate lyase
MLAMPEVLSLAPPAFAGARLLEEFYRREGLPLPDLHAIQGGGMPQPYRSLLVHSNDMTPTLEQFYGQRLWLRVRQRFQDGECYFREVALLEAQNGRPVEYGVIRIDLSRFDRAARRKILEEHYPLGRVLQEDAIAHTSWPRAFLQVPADARLRRILEFSRPTMLYGRRNLLLDGRRKLLADVIEILRPVEMANPQTSESPTNR